MKYNLFMASLGSFPPKIRKGKKMQIYFESRVSPLCNQTYFDCINTITNIYR